MDTVKGVSEAHPPCHFYKNCETMIYENFLNFHKSSAHGREAMLKRCQSVKCVQVRRT